VTEYEQNTCEDDRLVCEYDPYTIKLKINDEASIAEIQTLSMTLVTLIFALQKST
jgi:hypothetical protein